MGIAMHTRPPPPVRYKPMNENEKAAHAAQIYPCLPDDDDRNKPDVLDPENTVCNPAFGWLD
jgi:hypothetical protein